MGQYKTALDQFSHSFDKFNGSKTLNLINEIDLRAHIRFVLAQIKIANQQVDQANLLLVEALKFLDNDIFEAKNKVNMALYITIEKTMGVKTPRQDLVTYLKKIKYRNPDYIQP